MTNLQKTICGVGDGGGDLKLRRKKRGDGEGNGYENSRKDCLGEDGLEEHVGMHVVGNLLGKEVMRYMLYLFNSSRKNIYIYIYLNISIYLNLLYIECESVK